MNSKSKLRPLWWGLLLCLPLAAIAQQSEEEPVVQEVEESPPDSETPQTDIDPQATVSTLLPIYIPPSRGAAKSRVGAATRGVRIDLGVLMAFAPDHVGHTTNPQPKMYWYIEALSSTRIDLTLIDDTSAEPMIEITLEPPIAQGFHELDTASYDVTLEPDIVYQWFVAYVPNPDRRSNDVIASGAIQLVSGGPQTNREDPEALAKAGIWYDAVTILQQRLQSNPDDSGTVAALESLAQAVDLQLSLAN